MTWRFCIGILFLWNAAADQHIAGGEAEQVLRGAADVLFLRLLRAVAADYQERRRIFGKIFVYFIISLARKERALHLEAFVPSHLNRPAEVITVYLAQTVVDDLVVQLFLVLEPEHFP